MKCKLCNTELNEVVVEINGEISSVFCHRPETNCVDDGVRVEAEVTDLGLMREFQKNVVEGSEEQKEAIIQKESNTDLIKRRLAESELSIEEYLTIRRLLKED